MPKRIALSAPIALALATGAAALAENAPPAADIRADRPASENPPAAAQTGSHAPGARLPGFAPALANAPLIEDATGWAVLPDRDAWRAIAASTADTRQAARWDYARSLIGQARFAEAFGVLEAMGQDDPDLALVAAYQLARGAALVGLERYTDALDALSAGPLADNPEACAWRLRALAETDSHAEAVAQWTCARAAIASRTQRQGAPFLIAASQAALAQDKPRSALSLLQHLSDTDAAANLVRGRALLQLGDTQKARLRLARAADNGTPEQRLDARVSLLEGLVARGRAKPAQAAAELERIGFSWRGGQIERRALKLRFDLAQASRDDRAALAAGASLLRYHPMSGDSGALLAALQERLAAILSPASKVPLPEAAGLFWDYRDLAPGGAGGDFLVSQLADRLTGAGLYERAAELLDYQLTARAKDVAQGPLSVRVAKLYIMAGKPDDALAALRNTDGNVYPAPMRWARLRIEAVALHKLGRTDEALAVLDGVPEGTAIRDEIEWDRRNWQALSGAGDLPPATRTSLSAVEQTVILRRAVALAMLGRERSLAGLRERYAPAFAAQPTAAAFDLLTGPVDGLDSATVAQAMAAMPSASPAGEIADLLAVEPA